MGKRILFATFGSAGDLFPFVPTILQLRDQGHEVLVAVPRSLGLYLRSVGVATVGLGDGSELRVLADPDILSTRFDGWSSWRQTAESYLAPGLARDVAHLAQVIDRWAPSVLVASGFAGAARLAAATAGLPTVDASIYPQHQRLAGAGRFARRYRAVGSSLRAGADPDLPAGRWLWGEPCDVLLADPALIGPSRSEAVGFPSWEGVPGSEADARAVDDFAPDPSDTVVVTLGSFLGVTQRAWWTTAATAVGRLGLRAVFIGARSEWAMETFASRRDLCCVGFSPLPDVVRRAGAVVHHGGIGTSYASLRAGRPAVVVPLAFDQPHNGRLLEAAGCGRLHLPVDGERALASHIAWAISSDASNAVASVASQLIPAGVAATALARAALERA
jgi:UDP:flavonoid glycosyltransferase YjiC (YdhE family)